MRATGFKPASVYQFHHPGTQGRIIAAPSGRVMHQVADGLPEGALGTGAVRARYSLLRLKFRPDGLQLEVGVEVGVALLAADPRCLEAPERGRRVASAQVLM